MPCLVISEMVVGSAVIQNVPPITSTYRHHRNIAVLVFDKSMRACTVGILPSFMLCFVLPWDAITSVSLANSPIKYS